MNSDNECSVSAVSMFVPSSTTALELLMAHSDKYEYQQIEMKSTLVSGSKN